MKTNIIIAAGAAALGLTVYFFSVKKTTSPNPVDATSTTTIETDAAFASSDVANAFQEFIAVENNATPSFNPSSLSNGIAVFEANASSEIKINGPEGTEITFPANAFVDKNGNPVSGNIKIELNECYNLADMIGNKLSTKSNKELLETAGMVNLIVKQNGEMLSLSPNVRYDIAFPKNSDKDDFHLFYGQRNDDGNINWILDEKAEVTAQPEEVDEPEASQISVDNCSIQIVSSYFRRGTKVSKMDYYTWQLMDGSSFRNWVTTNFNPPLEMVTEYCVLGYETEVTLILDKDGYIKKHYLSKQSTPAWDAIVLNFVNTMPALDVSEYMPVYEEDHAVIVRFSRRTDFSRNNEATNIAKNFKKNKEGEIVAAKQADLSQYVYSASELGWLNCDRYIEQEAQRQDVFVKCENPEQTEMYMALVKYNGLLCGSRTSDGFVFHDVPKNLSVKMIGIKCESKPQLATKKDNTSNKKIELKNYEVFTLDKLKTEINGV